MIHGKDRAEVEARIIALAAVCDLDNYPHTSLFSQRRFKQRGAHYVKSNLPLEKETMHG